LPIISPRPVTRRWIMECEFERVRKVQEYLSKSTHMLLVGVILTGLGGCQQEEAAWEQKNTEATREYEKGTQLLEEGDLDPAIARFTEAIRLNPDLAVAYHARGVIHGKKQEFEKAIVDLSEAIRLKPDYAEAYANRGCCYVANGDLDKGFADFDEALRLNPNEAKAYCGRGVAYTVKGEMERAKADLERAKELDPNIGM
jgi:tetratricopeptide (TPR) repeat protein